MQSHADIKKRTAVFERKIPFIFKNNYQYKTSI